MVEVPEIADRTILKEELISLVASYQLLPQLLREMIVEGAIASISCTQEEVAIACQKFLQQHQITNAATHEAWLRRYGMTHQQ
ncbi:MAG: hypothetical protein HXY43_08475 [Fischerella sp.]|jgi:hypothetical protein|nr:hypothetical protein [Fischerella sp.]NWF59328.1 hypothetical protein [Fischerella sp.]